MPPSHTKFVIYSLHFMLARFFSINASQFRFLTSASKSPILSHSLLTSNHFFPNFYASSICHKLYFAIPHHYCTRRELPLAHGCPPGIDIDLWRISGWAIARSHRLENLGQRRVPRNSNCRRIRLAGPHIPLGIRPSGICSTQQWPVRALGAFVGIFQTH